MTSPILTLTRVRKSYSQTVALAGVDLAVAEGTFLAVMGPSGSGKSTLLRCAAGLEQPTSGSVVLAGTDLATLDEDALTRFRRDRVGFVFQGYQLLPYLSAAQNVELPLRLAGLARNADRVAEALRSVSLTGHADRRPEQLSGGEQQRTALARALVIQPAVLFADEPTGALDSAGAATVLTLMRRAVDERSRTIVMVTHDPLAAARADAVAFLRDGRVVGRLDAPDPDRVAWQLAHLGDLVTGAER